MSTTFSTLYTTLSTRLGDSGNNLWALADVKTFVNGALRRWSEMGGVIEVIDETKTTSADVVEYTLPSAITDARQVIDITLEGDSNEPYTALDAYHPRLITSAGSLPTTAPSVKLLISEEFPTAGKKLRIRYTTNQPALSSAGDLVDSVPTEFVYLYGKYLAHNAKCADASRADREWHEKERDVALRDIAAAGYARLVPLPAPKQVLPSGW